MVLLELFWVFFKIGAFTFGGGYAMLPFIQQEVISRGWLDFEEITNFIAVSESTPGPFAVNIATYIGVERGGIIGGIVATLGVILPSFIVILIVAKFFMKFRENRHISAILSGIKPVAIGLIAAAALSVFLGVFVTGKTTITDFFNFSFACSAVIFITCLIIALKKKSPVISIAFAALAGIITGYAGEALGLLK
jgi:chromate transporter